MQPGENPFTFASIKGGGATPSALSPSRRFKQRRICDI